MCIDNQSVLQFLLFLLYALISKGITSDVDILTLITVAFIKILARTLHRDDGSSKLVTLLGLFIKLAFPSLAVLFLSCLREHITSLQPLRRRPTSLCTPTTLIILPYVMTSDLSASSAPNQIKAVVAESAHYFLVGIQIAKASATSRMCSYQAEETHLSGPKPEDYNTE